MNNFEQEGLRDVDVTLGGFRFSKEERDAMKNRGMTDDEIEKKEHEVINRLANAQVKKEQGSA